MKIVLTNPYIIELIDTVLAEREPDTPECLTITIKIIRDVEEMLKLYFNGELDKTELSYDQYDYLNIVYIETRDTASTMFKRSVEVCNPRLLVPDGAILVEVIPIEESE